MVVVVVVVVDVVVVVVDVVDGVALVDDVVLVVVSNDVLLHPATIKVIASASPTRLFIGVLLATALLVAVLFMQPSPRSMPSSGSPPK